MPVVCIFLRCRQDLDDRYPSCRLFPPRVSQELYRACRVLKEKSGRRGQRARDMRPTCLYSHFAAVWRVRQVFDPQQQLLLFFFVRSRRGSFRHRVHVYRVARPLRLPRGGTITYGRHPRAASAGDDGRQEGAALFRQQDPEPAHRRDVRGQLRQVRGGADVHM